MHKKELLIPVAVIAFLAFLGLISIAILVFGDRWRLRAKRLGATESIIVYRRTRAEMPVRVEELHHAIEEGIQIKELRAPREFTGDDKTNFVTYAMLDVMGLGEPDASGRRSPVPTGEVEPMKIDLVIMALGNTPNPIIKDSEPTLKTTKWGTIGVGDGANSQETSLAGVYSGGDAARGGSTAIRAAGDGQTAARQIVGDMNLVPETVRSMVKSAEHYTELGAAPQTILQKIELADNIVEFIVHSPLIASTARAGHASRTLASA